MFTNSILLKSLVFFSFVVLILAIGNLLLKPHLSQVSFSQQQQRMSVENSEIMLRFSEVMDKNSFKDNIVVTPNVVFTTSWRKDTLYITFANTLEYATQYTLLIKREVISSYGSNPDTDLSISFKTEGRVITFAEDNTLVQYDLDTMVAIKKPISSPFISYSLGKDSSFFLLSDILTSSQILGITKDDEKKLSVPKKQIYQIATSKILNKAIILAQEDIIPDTEDEYPRRTIYLLDQKSESIQRVYPESFNLDIERFSIDVTGRILLFRDTVEGLYYITDLFTPNINPILLGSFAGIGGISLDKNQILFIDDETAKLHGNLVLQKVNTNGEKKQLTPITQNIQDPAFIPNSTKVVYSREYKQSNLQVLYEAIIASEDGTILKVLHIDGKSIEVARPSPNGRYIICEVYTEDDKNNPDPNRIIEFLSRPKTGELFIYDIKTEEFKSLGIRGASIAWEHIN